MKKLFSTKELSSLSQPQQTVASVKVSSKDSGTQTPPLTNLSPSDKKTSSHKKLFKSRPALVTSASFPVTKCSKQEAGPVSSYCYQLLDRSQSSPVFRRPLPMIPTQDQSSRLQRLSLQQQWLGHSSQASQGENRRELHRRETFHNYPLHKHDREEHIYEEINDEDSDEEDIDKDEVNEYSFLSLISLERRKHLKFYGRADWDYGNERF